MMGNDEKSCVDCGWEWCVYSNDPRRLAVGNYFDFHDWGQYPQEISNLKLIQLLYLANNSKVRSFRHCCENLSDKFVVKEQCDLPVNTTGIFLHVNKSWCSRWQLWQSLIQLTLLLMLIQTSFLCHLKVYKSINESLCSCANVQGIAILRCSPIISKATPLSRKQQNARTSFCTKLFPGTLVSYMDRNGQNTLWTPERRSWKSSWENNTLLNSKRIIAEKPLYKWSLHLITL